MGQNLAWQVFLAAVYGSFALYGLYRFIYQLYSPQENK